MPEPLKNLYNRELIENLAEEVKGVFGGFDTAGFVVDVMDERWEGEELKERMRHISESLRRFLPVDYVEALSILEEVAPTFSGFQYMFFPGFVELYGLDEYEASVGALEVFTPYSSSEFAVRPFIKKYGDEMMGQMGRWAESDDEHVRRLSSEGCRPRLPWAMALPEFKKDPSAVLPILERLKDDESEYVRRSVANNLNDISKDHVDVVVAIAKRWLGHSPKTDGVVKHACRTLLKQGHPEVMNLFGFTKPSHMKVKGLEVQGRVKVGERLDFSFMVETRGPKLGKLRIEYGVDFMKKNGKLSRKVFKISESDVGVQSKVVCKSHSFKEISTRKYYSGEHQVTVIINGHEMAKGRFELEGS